VWQYGPAECQTLADECSLQERYGLKVVPYTVDDESTMDRVIALGVDGLISDDPELLVKVAKRAGLR
jgi:glycerophosphoryl diester phosphodiesterase